MSLSYERRIVDSSTLWLIRSCCSQLVLRKPTLPVSFAPVELIAAQLDAWPFVVAMGRAYVKR
jgi:hypothetical protein